jgi:cytochrome c nitrite reductase small subunit
MTLRRPRRHRVSPPRSANVPPTFRLERIFNSAILGLFGVAFGLGLFTFFYAEGFSYFSNDPAACINCHIMRDQFEG